MSDQASSENDENTISAQPKGRIDNGIEHQVRPWLFRLSAILWNLALLLLSLAVGAASIAVYVPSYSAPPAWLLPLVKAAGLLGGGLYFIMLISGYVWRQPKADNFWGAERLRSLALFSLISLLWLTSFFAWQSMERYIQARDAQARLFLLTNELCAGQKREERSPACKLARERALELGASINSCLAYGDDKYCKPRLKKLLITPYREIPVPTAQPQTSSQN